MLEDDVFERLEVPEREDSDPGWRRRAERLVTNAGGRREPLERLRARLLERLHRASDDFEATEALRVTEAALGLVPRPEGIWAWQRREQERRRLRSPTARS